MSASALPSAPSALSSRPSPSTARRIVVGVDGSEPSLAALRWAHHLALLLGSTVQAVAVWQPTTAVGLAGEGWGPVPADWDPVAVTCQTLNQSLTSVFGDDRPDGLDERIEQGRCAQVLIDLSSDAQMLVVGSRGHGGFAGLLLGSVSAACAEHATCPVLVVHGTTPPPPSIPPPTSPTVRTEATS